MKSWAKIRGAYVLSRRNIARIIAAIAAALLSFHTATAALSPADEALSRRAYDAMCRIYPIKDSMPPTETRIPVSDRLFEEVTALFFEFRHLVPEEAARRVSVAAPRPPAARFHSVRVRSWRLHDSTRDGEGLIILPMSSEGEGKDEDGSPSRIAPLRYGGQGWFNARAERRRAEVQVCRVMSRD